MSFLDTLNIAATLPEVQYHNFLLQYKFADSTIHLFYEGVEDATFYNSYVQNMLGFDHKFEEYICDGKDKVLKNYSLINWEKYNKNRVLFFIDKDLEDILGDNKFADDNIFKTKNYSIENYLVDQSVVDRFLSESCNLRDVSRRKLILNEFEIQLKRFHRQLLTLSAWIVFCRRKNFNLNLDDIRIADFIFMDKELKVFKKTPEGYANIHEYVCIRTKTDHPIPPGEIYKISKDLKKKYAFKSFIRGKYEIHFLLIFCQKVITEILPILNTSITAYNKTRPKNTDSIRKCILFKITEENLFDILSSKVQIPKELRDFLKTNLTKANVLN